MCCASLTAALVSKHRPGGLTAYVVAGDDGGFGGGAPTLHRTSVMKLAGEDARRRAAVAAERSVRAQQRQQQEARRGQQPQEGSGEGGRSGGSGGSGGSGDDISAVEPGDVPEEKLETATGHPFLDLPGAPFSRLWGGMHNSGGPSCAASGGEETNSSGGGGGPNPTQDWTPMIILVPLVLGLDKNINPRYLPSLLAMLSLPQTLGIIGGRPAASLYFVGAQDDNLFYLDPHTVHPTVPITRPDDGRGEGGGDAGSGGAVASSGEYSDGGGCGGEGRGRSGRSRGNNGSGGGGTSGGVFPTESYHCGAVLHLNGRELDPSMALGFYCRTKSDFDSLYIELELLSRKAGSTPLLTVAQGPPPPSPLKHPPARSSRGGGGMGAGAGVRSAGVYDPLATSSDESEADTEESEDWEML